MQKPGQEKSLKADDPEVKPPLAFITASILASATGPLISMIDTGVAARMSSQDLAGLVLGGALAGGIGWIVSQAIGGLPGVLGRLAGADRQAEVAKLGGEAVLCALAIGLLLTVPLVLSFEAACQLMAEHGPTSEGAAHYLAIRLLGLPLDLVFQALVAIHRNVLKDAWTPLWAVTAILVANATLNILFCIYLPGGLAGLAIASAGSLLFGIAICWRRLQREGLLDFHQRWSALRRWQPSAGMRLSLQLGGPALLRGLLLNATLLTSSILAERFGTEALGAHGLAFQIWLFIAFAIDGFALAGQAYGSQLLGSGDREATRSLAWELNRFCLVGGLILGLALYGAWDFLPVVFGLDGSAALAFSTLALPLLSQIPLGVGAFVSDGLLQGAGDQRFLFIQMSLASLTAFPLALWLLPGSLAGLWWAVAAWLLLRASLGLARLAGDGWLDLSEQQMADL